MTIVTQRVVGESAVVSMLTLLNPTPDRAGVYACRPEHLDPAYVRLHIVQGKTTPTIAAVMGNLKFKSRGLRIIQYSWSGLFKRLVFG